MAPLAMASSVYNSPKALSSSKYASPVQKEAQLAAASSAPASAPSIPDTAIATKQQIATLESAGEVTPRSAELAVEQGIALNKEVQSHTKNFSRTVSSAVSNTHRLLGLLRESTPGSEVVDDLWKELEQLYEAANNATAILPEFMEKQRDNMSLYHSSMMNEIIRETQEELNFQHKKVNTQHNLILEQQDAFHNYKAQTASKFNELEGLHERVSRLTLEKGNLRTELDKYKSLLEQATVKQAEDAAITDVLQKELETLASSKKQLQADNEVLQKEIVELLEQLKTIEHRVTEKFVKELAARTEEFQKESAKTVALNTMVNALKNGESALKKELDKVKNEYRQLSVSYSNQASEHAAAFTKMKEQAQKTEALTAEVDRLQQQNADLQSKMQDAAKLTKTNMELSKARETVSQQLQTLTLQFNETKDGNKTLQQEVQQLKLELATKKASAAPSDDKTLLDRIKHLEEEKNSQEVALKEWTELAKRSYKEYKDILVRFNEAEKYKVDSEEKQLRIVGLEKQLALLNVAPPNGMSVAVDGDTAYWKQKYDTLLASI